MRIDNWCDDDSPYAACLNECSPFPRGSFISIAATAGTTYYFEVGSYNQNAAGCELCLGVVVTIGPPAPTNDLCTVPIAVGEGSYAFDTRGATTDGPTLPELCDEGAGLWFVNDVWYRYTAACTGTATVSLCASDYDTRLAIYGMGSCPGGFIACNDDACGDIGLQSRVSFETVQGAAYLVRLGGFSGSGQGTMVIACTPGAACPADVDGNGEVGFNDVLAVLSFWGPCAGCPADVDHNGDVGFSDLLLILSTWGPCP
jgi:hypothetical protein